MAARFPSALPRRPTAPIISSSLSTPSALKPSHTPLSHTPSRAATIIRRPRRPYTFTQLVQQTDGSTYTMRTTSPFALYKSTKDTRNHLLWQPSDRSLKNVEVDEAGKLAAFRERFGRAWDMEKSPEAAAAEAAAAADGKAGEGAGEGAAAKVEEEPVEDALSDLFNKYAMKAEQPTKKVRGKGKK